MTSFRGTVVLGVAGIAVLTLNLVSAHQIVRPWFQSATQIQMAAQVAGEFVEAYGSFNYRDPAAYRERLLGLTEGPLRDAFRSGGADPAAIGQQQTQQTNLLHTRVSTIDDRRATVTVKAKQTIVMAGKAVHHRLREFTCTLAQTASDEGTQSGPWRVVTFRLVAERAIQQTDVR